jgi:hypothetical protein
MESYIRTGWETGFFQSPNCIFDVDDLTIAERLCYLYLCRCADSDMKSFPSYDTIGKKMGASRRTAIKSVGILEEKGYLRVERRKASKDKNLSNIYTLIHPDEVIHSGENSAPPPSAKSAPYGENSAPNKYPDINTQNKKDIHIYKGHAEKKEFQFYDWVNNK